MSEWTEGVFRHMNVRLVKDTQRCRRDEWTNWAEGRVNGIRNRASRNKAQVVDSAKLNTWKESCAWMLCGARSRVRRAQLDKWSKWAVAISGGICVRANRCPKPVAVVNKYISKRFEPKQRVKKPAKEHGPKVIQPWHKIVDKYGFQMLLSEFYRHAEQRGFKPKTCYFRVRRQGMSLVDAISEPLGKPMARSKMWIDVTKGGETKPVIEWLRKGGIGKKTFERRLRKKGWSLERAATQPLDTEAQRRSMDYASREGEVKTAKRIDREAAV